MQMIVSNIIWSLQLYMITIPNVNYKDQKALVEIYCFPAFPNAPYLYKKLNTWSDKMHLVLQTIH